MTDTLLPAEASAVAVLDAATGAVASLVDTLWAARPAPELLQSVRAVERLRSVLDAVLLRIVAEVHVTGAAATEGWATTRDFLTATTGGRVGEGRRLLTLATAVGSDRVATGAALAAGDISRAQAAVIVAAVDRLPARRPEAESRCRGAPGRPGPHP